MQNDKQTAANDPKNGLISKLRNQPQHIPLTWVEGPILLTSISAAC
jgi:hypothetical protein